MWILVFVVLISLPGMDKVHKLESYHTKEACLRELDRVMTEMKKTYPADTDWTLECRPSGVQA